MIFFLLSCIPQYFSPWGVNKVVFIMQAYVTALCINVGKMISAVPLVDLTVEKQKENK